MCCLQVLTHVYEWRWSMDKEVIVAAAQGARKPDVGLYVLALIELARQLQETKQVPNRPVGRRAVQRG